MRLTHLTLHNFRNYVRLDFDPAAGVTVLIGNNAQGKTNLLESIYYLATSRSPHASADRELVNWLASEQEPLPYARLVGRVTRAAGDLNIEITLTQQENDDSRYRKQIRLNGVARRAMDLLGQLNVVLFLPEDISLISGSPSSRRRYLDATLCQIDPAYCRALSRYNQVLSQRNALLRDLRERGGDPAQLAFWDDRLLDHGAQVVARRRTAVLLLDELARAVHLQLTDAVEHLRLQYMPSVELGEREAADEVRARFEEQIRELRRREIAAGMTLVGPHRDELRFLINDMDTGIYGSRGQQRTVALALKLAEVNLMRRETDEYPVLLLDDVLSELDAERRAFLLHYLQDGPQQAVITTSDLSALPAAFTERCQMWRVRMGCLAAEDSEADIQEPPNASLHPAALADLQSD